MVDDLVGEMALALEAIDEVTEHSTCLRRRLGTLFLNDVRNIVLSKDRL